MDTPLFLNLFQEGGFFISSGSHPYCGIRRSQGVCLCILKTTSPKHQGNLSFPPLYWSWRYFRKAQETLVPERSILLETFAPHRMLLGLEVLKILWNLPTLCDWAPLWWQPFCCAASYQFSKFQKAQESWGSLPGELQNRKKGASLT